jgi:2-C-methyl-D-erythritol 4-phosphate cytidylyltransferase
MTYGIIVAAGTGTRMGFDKIFADLCGKPVLQYSLEAFAAAKSIDEIIVVTRPDNITRVRRLCPDCTVVTGGADRAESVGRGVDAIAHEHGVIAIHDGARPLITPALIDSTVTAVNGQREYQGAIPTVPVKDTVKEVEGGFVRNTPDRAVLHAAQTPQVFDLCMYRKAFEQYMLSPGGGITDDSMLMESAGFKVRIVEGDYRNIKITTPEDLFAAQALIVQRSSVS